MHDEEHEEHEEHEERDELLCDAVLGELGPERQKQWEEALHASPELRREHQELSQLWLHLGQALEVPRAGRSPLRVARPRSWMAWSAGIAAALVGFLAGAWWAGNDTVAPTPAGERFAILLYAGGAPAPSDRPPVNPEFLARVVQEHRDWADRLRQENRHVLSEKLDTAAGVDLVTVQGTVEARRESADLGGRRLGGLYIVTAPDLEAATEIARGCPLLNYGGVVRVRPIESTEPRAEGFQEGER